MQRLLDLKKAIEQSGVVNPETVEVRGEDGEPSWAESQSGADMLLFRHRYVGVLEFFNAHGDLVDLLAAVLVWLHENIPADEVDDNHLLGWSGEPVDNHKSDLELRFQFEESIHYVPAEQGYTGRDKVTVNGAEWKRGAVAADVANALQTVEGTTAP